MSTSVAPSAFVTADIVRWADARPEIFVPRDQIPPSLLAAEATTLGWDCVNAIRLPQVNAALARSGTSPTDFDITVQPGWQLTGTFGTWQVTRGGSGAIVFLRTPLTSAHMTFTGSPDLDVTDGWATVSVKLQYLPQPPGGAAEPARESGDEAHKEYLATSTTARSEDDPAIVIQAVGYGGAQPTELQKALFPAALAEWFNANLSSFTYVFSTVNINAKAAKEQFQWLKPTYTSYAYFNGASDDQSYFGVLNLTSDRSPDGLTNQLPPSAIPADAQGSVLVSSELFIRNMILPGLTKTFVRSTESDFRLSSNGTVIENVNNLTLDDIKIDAASYTPIIESFRLQVVGDEIQIDTKTHVNVSPGIDVYITSTEFYGVTLVDRPEGGQTLDFVKTRDAKRNHWLETATWIIVTEILIGIVAAIASTVAGKLIESLARRVIAILIIALVAGLAAAIPAIIGKVMEGKAAEALPPIGDLVMEASSDVHWPDSTGFTLVSAQLNGSLQLGGNLDIPPAG